MSTEIHFPIILLFMVKQVLKYYLKEGWTQVHATFLELDLIILKVLSNLDDFMIQCLLSQSLYRLKLHKIR